MTTLTRSETVSRLRRAALVVGAIGIVAAIVGVLTDPTAFLRAYLVGFAFVASLSLGSLFMLMLNYVTGGLWGGLLRRYFEIGAQLNVVVAILFIPILLGLPQLYPWAQPETVAADPLLQHQSAFLNPTFFTVRAVIYFAVWFFLSWRITRPNPKRSMAIFGVILHFPLATFAAIDWFMSLEPHWYSTIYGVVFLATQALTAYTFALIMLRFMRASATENSERQTRQDLGNVLLVILIVTIYLQFMQFLVIWAGDLPDEISWYLARTAGGWLWIALLLILLDVVVPFLFLLSFRVKNSISRLSLVALLMLAMQFVYAYWLILPAFGSAVSWIDFILPAGMAGVWFAAFIYRLPAVRERAEDES